MKIVIALGGNALGNTPTEQLELVKKTSKTIVDLVEDGHNVVVSHGNGPQVGIINQAMDYAASQNIGTPEMPFPECGAMSQGYIGYHLQQAIENELADRDVHKNVVTLVTQVEVDPEDDAFENPTKPIGNFYTEEEAKKLEQENGFTMKEDAGRGWRRVVPSPVPINIVELETIRTLVEEGKIVISCGGGGIPVIKEDGKYKGVPAVIDKDNSSCRLAIDLGADMLMILTAVDKVCINYNKENQQELSELNAYDVEGAMNIVAGTARNMGVAVEGVNDQELAEEVEEAQAQEIADAKREAKLEAMEASAADTNVEAEVITEKAEEE